MPRRPLRVTGASEAPLRAALAAVRTALDVPGGLRAAPPRCRWASG
ncbi:hypothetical protein [Streptomyces sp. CB01373]|nr:hypothetical protein [Streptomyces sp. CB01373]